jgi:hypothetical protein
MSTGFGLWDYKTTKNLMNWHCIGKPRYVHMTKKFIGHGKIEDEAIKDMKDQEYSQEPKYVTT